MKKPLPVIRCTSDHWDAGTCTHPEIAPDAPRTVSADLCALVCGLGVLTGEVMQVRVVWSATRLAQFRAMWAELHAHRLSPDTPAWLESLAARVPCGECRTHWRAIVAAQPPDLSSQAAFDTWAIDRHNDVNALIGNPAWSAP